MMAKKWFGLLEALAIVVLVLVLLFSPLYVYVNADGAGVSLAFFPYAIKTGPSSLTLAGGISLLLLLPLAAFKAYVAFRWPLEQEEKASFFIYLGWGLLGIIFFVAAGSASCWAAFSVALVLAALSLVFFAFDYHFYGQN
jgi:hypothetical protein